MATPPSTTAGTELRPPPNLPIAVRAPATMTEPISSRLASREWQSVTNRSRRAIPDSVGHRLGRAAAALILAALAVGVVAWVATPDARDAQARVDALAARLKVPVLRPAAVPELLALAVVATEDERFYSHHGIDVPGIVRAVVDDVRMRCLCEGASTITEQLVKEVYLNGSDAGLNKVVEGK